MYWYIVTIIVAITGTIPLSLYAYIYRSPVSKVITAIRQVPHHCIHILSLYIPTLYLLCYVMYCVMLPCM